MLDLDLKWPIMHNKSMIMRKSVSPQLLRLIHCTHAESSMSHIRCLVINPMLSSPNLKVAPFDEATAVYTGIHDMCQRRV